MSRNHKLSLLIGGGVLALALVLALFLSSTTSSPSRRLTVAIACPAGNSAMGCASRPQLSLEPKYKLRFGFPAGPKFPDVSSYQGHPNWAAAKSSISMGVAKAGEYSEDPSFAFNVATLKALGIPWAPYWFIRNTGCAHEAAEYIAAIRSVGGLTSLPPVLDMEVPEARGYAPCMANALHAAFGRWPIIYTAPGTWPGGASDNLPLWIADYGPSFPCMWTCHPVAWQFASPPYVFYSFPGLGAIDASVDYGFSKLLPVPPKPVDPHHYAWFINGSFASPYGPLNERSVVLHYDGARQHPLKYRNYLRHLERELVYLAKRVYVIAHRQPIHHHPSWGVAHRGGRFAELVKRAEGGHG